MQSYSANHQVIGRYIVTHSNVLVDVMAIGSLVEDAPLRIIIINFTFVKLSLHEMTLEQRGDIPTAERRMPMETSCVEISVPTEQKTSENAAIISAAKTKLVFPFSKSTKVLTRSSLHFWSQHIRYGHIRERNFSDAMNIAWMESIWPFLQKRQEFCFLTDCWKYKSYHDRFNLLEIF